MSNLTLHNLKLYCSMFNNCLWRTTSVLIKPAINYCSTKGATPPKVLFKYLTRQCDKLPEGAKKYYKFMIRQSFKQHVNETDPERIRQIVARSYEDADWVLKKYLKKE